MDPARVRLGRIRCLINTVNAMRKGEPLPAPLCFVPVEVNIEFEGTEQLPVYETAKEDAKVVGLIQPKKNQKLGCVGLPTFNAAGGWLKMTSPQTGWVLLQPRKKAFNGKLKILKKAEEVGGGGGNGGGKEGKANWLKAVEVMCSLQMVRTLSLQNHDKAILRLQTPSPGWNMEADEELAQFLVDNNVSDSFALGGMKGKGGENFVKIEVSSEESEVSNILNPDPDVYWESDGSQHCVRFTLVPGTIIERFAILVDPEDGSYLPQRVVVKAGRLGNLSTMHTHTFNLSDYARKELQQLPIPLQEFKEVIEVHFKSYATKEG